MTRPQPQNLDPNLLFFRTDNVLESRKSLTTWKNQTKQKEGQAKWNRQRKLTEAIIIVHHLSGRSFRSVRPFGDRFWSSHLGTGDRETTWLGPELQRRECKLNTTVQLAASVAIWPELRGALDGHFRTTTLEGGTDCVIVEGTGLGILNLKKIWTKVVWFFFSTRRNYPTRLFSRFLKKKFRNEEGKWNWQL